MSQPGQAPDPLSQCLAALDALYVNQDNTIKHQANQWLMAFEKDKMAWIVADQILHRQGLAVHSYLFAANLLLAKVQHFLFELAEQGHRIAFRDSLLSHAMRFATTDFPIIRSKLAQTVACLAVHMIGMGEWEGAMNALVTTFGKDAQTALMLLDILTYLPEENHNNKLFITAAVRARAQKELTKNTEQVVALLMQFLASSSSQTGPNGQQTDYISSGILHTPNAGPQALKLPHVTGLQKSMHTKILQTFLAWVKASGENRQLTPVAGVQNTQGTAILSSENLIQHPLLLFCFKIIASQCDELEQIAIDVICSLLQNFNLVSRSIRGGFRGFRTARQHVEEAEWEEGEFAGDDDGQYSQGSFAPSQQPPVQKNQYEHLYFMRFMLSKIFELVPLFEALPPKDPDLLPFQDDAETDVAKWYGRLFGDLAEFYLDFCMEFCLGVEGFSEQLDPEAVQNLSSLVLDMSRKEASKKGQPMPTQLMPGQMEGFVAENQKMVGSVVEIILKCVAHPRREVNSYVMYFFFLLSEALNAPVEYRVSREQYKHQQQQQQQNGNVLTPLQLRAKKKQAFLPAFQALIPILHRLITFPKQWQPPNAQNSAAQELSQDSRDEIRKIRVQCGHALGDVERIVGYEAILEVITGDQCMGAQIQAFMNDPRNWRELEASLYCIFILGPSIFRVADDDRITKSIVFQQGGRTHQFLIPKVFDLLLNPQAPVWQNQALKYTTLRIFNQYAPWVREYVKAHPTGQDGQDYLNKVLACIVTGLQDPTVCKAASRALRVTCEENRSRLANNQNPNYIEGLMGVYNKCCVIPVVGSGKNEAGFTLEDQLAIIQGVAQVVSNVHSPPTQPGAAPNPNANALPHYLNQLTFPMVSEMQKILQSLQSQTQQNGIIAVPPAASASLSNHLERLAETIAFLIPSENAHREFFIACILDHWQKVLAPTLYMILQHLCDDERRMDKLSRVVKHVIRMTKLEFLTSCLEPLIHQLHAAFHRFPHPCFVYLLGKCVEAFGMHPNFHPILQQMLPAFIVRCLEIIPNLQAMIQNPEMTEDFFDACLRVLEVCPNILFQLQTLPQIIERCIMGLSLQHKDSLSAVCCFLGNFLQQGVDSHDAVKKRFGHKAIPEHIAVIRQCLQAYGQPLCDALIAAVAGAIPDHLIHHLHRVFENLIIFSKEECKQWLYQALTKVPDTADPTKQEFLDSLFEYRVSVLQRSLYRFSHASRINRDVER